MYEGGCFCGAIRYRVSAEPIDTGYCHCSICRRTTAAPVVAWATFPAESFTYLQGEPVTFHSSDWGHRRLCGVCGTQTHYQDNNDTTKIDINVCSLDEPSRCAPQYHIYTADRLPWFDTSDTLQRFPAGEPK